MTSTAARFARGTGRFIARVARAVSIMVISGDGRPLLAPPASLPPEEYRP